VAEAAEAGRQRPGCRATAARRLPCLERLDLSFNRLRNASGLPAAPRLAALSLLRNAVPPRAAAMRGLRCYPRLASLALRLNPISAAGPADPAYRELVAWAVPGLRLLDGQPFVDPLRADLDAAAAPGGGGAG
jgi:hypothetical protein